MNSFQLLGRERKAATIADFLLSKGMTADDVRTGLDDEAAWKLVASELYIKKVASDETRKLVLGLMERAELMWAGENTNDV